MENGKSIGDVIGQALRPMPAMSERTILDELRERLREVNREERELDARRHEVEEQIQRIEGDETGAEWHRLAVIAARSGTPEDRQAAHRAWVHDMAVHLLKRGARPDMGSHCQAEIDEECDRLTVGNVQ